MKLNTTELKTPTTKIGNVWDLVSHAMFSFLSTVKFSSTFSRSTDLTRQYAIVRQKKVTMFLHFLNESNKLMVYSKTDDKS